MKYRRWVLHFNFQIILIKKKKKLATRINVHVLLTLSVSYKKKKNVLVVKSILGNGNLRIITKKLKKTGPRQRRRKPEKWKVAAHDIRVWVGVIFYLNFESPIKFPLLLSSLFIINRLPLLSVSVSHKHCEEKKKKKKSLSHSLTLQL